MKKVGTPIAITMCIGPIDDFKDVSVEDVARLVKAGKDLGNIGLTQ